MKRWYLLAAPFVLMACTESTPTQPAEAPSINAAFDEFGYNDVAGIFNGAADGVDRNLDGTVWGDPTYANDHLVMKWNKEWVRGKAEGWSDPNGYGAWETNEWNGQVDGGSGEVWHYKIKWDRGCKDTNSPPEGAYCIWGQFAVVMDMGTLDNEHSWNAHAKASGFGN